MAITDAYAGVSEYRDRNRSASDVADEWIEDVVLAVCRLIDKETNRTFNQDASAVARLFDGSGTARVYIDDVAALTSVKVDLDADFDFDGTNETLTPNTHFFLGPANAALGPEPHPYRFLDIKPANGVLSAWPKQLRAIEVTAKFGWPAVPAIIKEAAILMTREVLDLQKSGVVLAVQNIEEAIQMAPNAPGILARIKREYGRQGALFA